MPKNKNKIAVKSRKKTKLIHEIDLHIHEIIDSDQHLTNFEKLQLQISTLDNFVRKMVKKNSEEMIFYKGKITQCNRIVTMPLTDYLTMKFNGEYRYMNNPSILGVHIEKINVVSLWKRFT